jgi:hypothetical protein
MGKALKKNQDYTTMNRLKWAAWGVIDIEKLERMQRRNYINHVREELKQHGCTLECGGGRAGPYYRVYKQRVHGDLEWSVLTTPHERQAGNAFSRVCYKALVKLDPDFELAEKASALV